MARMFAEARSRAGCAAARRGRQFSAQPAAGRAQLRNQRSQRDAAGHGALCRPVHLHDQSVRRARRRCAAPLHLQDPLPPAASRRNASGCSLPRRWPATPCSSPPTTASACAMLDVLTAGDFAAVKRQVEILDEAFMPTNSCRSSNPSIGSNPRFAIGAASASSTDAGPCRGRSARAGTKHSSPPQIWPISRHELSCRIPFRRCSPGLAGAMFAAACTALNKNIMASTLLTVAPWLLLTCLIASLSAYAALDLGKRMQSTEIAEGRQWLLGSGLAWGTGVWSVHVLSMNFQPLELRRRLSPGRCICGLAGRSRRRHGRLPDDRHP